jgi:hypothetical protein
MQRADGEPFCPLLRRLLSAFPNRRLTAMKEENWRKTMVEEVWAIIPLWELLREYNAKKPEGPFFFITYFAIRNDLIIRICRTIELCDKVPDSALDDFARLKRTELRGLYNKGRITTGKPQLDFPDCGLKVLRDKILAHPDAQGNELLEKDPYAISVKWKTIGETIEQLTKFCQAVESSQNFGFHHMGEMGDGARSLRPILSAMDDAKKLRKLKLEMTARGNPITVSFDFATNEFVIVE